MTSFSGLKGEIKKLAWHVRKPIFRDSVFLTGFRLAGIRPLFSLPSFTGKWQQATGRLFSSLFLLLSFSLLLFPALYQSPIPTS
jgi:hypothetical protein